MTTIKGLHIPANIWRPVEYVDVLVGIDEDDPSIVQIAFAPLRELLDCRTIEIIQPNRELPEIGFDYIGVCDEEARLVNQPARNARATVLFGYDYPIVGDLVVVGHRRFSDLSLPDTLLPTLQGRTPS